MFADDLLVLSESKEGLQESLKKFHHSREWQLTVNCNKTKTLIFGKNLKNIKNTKFSYRNTYLENVSEFKFLGNVITQNENLVSCAEALSEKTLKVMYSIKSYTSSLNELPVNVSTHLFDSLVRPILTYNCEIWNMDVYKPYFNATEKAKKNIFNVDKMQFIEKKLLTTRYIISSVNLFLKSKNVQAIVQPDMS